MANEKEVRQWFVNLDSELVVKNLLFSFIFVCLVAMGINYLLLPMIKEYKITISEENKNRAVLNIVNNRFNSVQGAYSLFINQNKKLLDTLHYQIEVENIKNFLSHFFMEAKVVQKQSILDEEAGLLKTDFEIKVIAKDLQSIQNFFDATKDAPMNLRVIVPFVIKKQKKGLEVKFVMQNKRSTIDFF
ncbi:hypothetical protein [Helicobacter anatolicus]|uniref:hypothetical protein n=1 Tax=Helicobacter anatolicus TaxID=2905874 RepID=UPI001E2B9A7F|nr:hypothetical protein [Helicobacter anatolicus]MCE3038850.1 hypothetical protein [Helicobacter anatolicus]